MRTLSVRPVSEGGPDDLDGTIVDGIEALRQRVQQRLRFPAGTWQLDTRKGIESVRGHGSPVEIAAAVITAAIVDEGGNELTGPPAVEFSLDHDTRVMTYEATVPTIYGTMQVRAPII